MNAQQKAMGNSGVKVSYILSASKNIKVNADQNISIKELISNNKDRTDTTPYFQLAYEPPGETLARNLVYLNDRIENNATDGILSDGGGQVVVSSHSSQR